MALVVEDGSGVKAAVFVQHENGGTKYTDEGKPYIEKV